MRYLSLLLLILSSASCLDEPDCLVLATNVLKFSFVKADKTEAKYTFTKITTSGTTKIFFTESPVSGLALSVDPASTQTTFVFTHDGKDEKVVVQYDKTHKVISTKCGAYTYYNNLSVVETTASSAKVINKLFATTVTKNLEIIF